MVSRPLLGERRNSPQRCAPRREATEVESNFTQRAEARMRASPELAGELAEIVGSLTEGNRNKV